MTINVGLIGYGYWGPNLARNIQATDGMRLAAIADCDPSSQKRAAATFPQARILAEATELIGSAGLDAIVIASPVNRHAEHALAALRAGRHVLVEKPMVTRSEDALLLIEEAEKRQLTLMVDHTFVYHGAIRKIRQLLDSDHLGKLLYYDSVRINLGLFQSDVDVLWDLAAHDVSIMSYLIGKSPSTVSCIGQRHFENTPTNMAYLTMLFEDGLIAHTHVNWLSPVKLRRTLIGGDRRMAIYDDLDPDEKVKIYDRGVSIQSAPKLPTEKKVDYRTGDVAIPALDRTEALVRVVSHFRDCIRSGSKPETGGREGLEVVRILETAQESLSRQGQSIPLPG